MYRGTLRLKGWCETLDVMKSLKLLSDDSKQFNGMSYADMMAMMIGEKDIIDIRQKVADKLKIKYNAHALKAMEWLGLFDNVKMNRERIRLLKLCPI